MKSNKKIWIVGGSTGIGLELVKLCLKNDYFVVASSRTASSSDSLLQIQKDYSKNLHLLDIDVSKMDTIKDCVKQAWEIYDGLDIWFYNAGAYEVMSIDSWDNKKFEQMNQVNYLGVINIMTAILPYFRLEKKGHWVWNCSLSSYFGLPQGGGYSAPKAALVNLAESIKPELDILGVNLQIINHGFVKTRLTNKNNFKMPQLMHPDFTAKKILEGIEDASSFEIRFPFGLSLFLRFLRFLPYKLSLAITKKMLP